MMAKLVRSSPHACLWVSPLSRPLTREANVSAAGRGARRGSAHGRGIVPGVDGRAPKGIGWLNGVECVSRRAVFESRSARHMQAHNALREVEAHCKHDDEVACAHLQGK